MDGYESTRRNFLRKLGLSIGATVVVGKGIEASIRENNVEFPISEKQEKFLKKYEEWMDDFIEVIKGRRAEPENLTLNKKMVELSNQAEKWQPILKKYMKDEDFARRYMIISERMTHEID